MTARSIRRAAERKARKLARKAEKEALTQTATVDELDWDLPAEPPEPPLSVYEAASLSVPKIQMYEAAPLSVPKSPTTPSPARLAANRANAQRPTGPRTSAGKEVCSLNALKTGLTGRTVLLPSEGAEQYRCHVDRFFADYKPATDQERELVQNIADTAWRLLRIPALETNLFALGRIQFKEMFQDEDAGLRPGLIEAYTLVAFQKQFSNLSLQESRLLRRFEKTRAELTALQSRRRPVKPEPITSAIGSEFSTPPRPAPKSSGAAEEPLTPEHRALVEAAKARFANAQPGRVGFRPAMCPTSNSSPEPAGTCGAGC